MDTTSAEILTIEEAAAFLRIPVPSMYRLAQLGKVPAAKPYPPASPMTLPAERSAGFILR